MLNRNILMVALFLNLFMMQALKLRGQDIIINSVMNARQPTGDNGYTLDGLEMRDSRSKLLNHALFGTQGIYPKLIGINDAFSATGSLTRTTALPLGQMFFFGTFDKNNASTHQFTIAEIDSLYQWSKRGGRLIIAPTANISGTGNDFSVLNSRWGFELALDVPSGFIPTLAGENSTIFNGPFGTAYLAVQGGGSQGYFSVIPPNSIVLATNITYQPTLILDCNTLDLIAADVDGYTTLGGISPGNLIRSVQDTFWANTIVFMDQLQNPPLIIQNGFSLSTQNFNTYQWYFNGEPMPEENTQSLEVTQNGYYSVQATLSCGCKIMSDTVFINNYDNKYAVPDAFTPNGDGKNDVLFVKCKDMDNMYFSIYDRWGEKVFESRDINQGWDGYFKGKPLPSQVFLYYLQGTLGTGKRIEGKGMITLLR